jgi:hypothetical protein
MDLPLIFEFSQGSLQDYSDCRRRFLLKYIKHAAWPAVHAEPAIENERHIQRGARFHRLAQQFLMGVPPARLSECANADQDDHLAQWWRSFTSGIVPIIKGTQFIELTLSAQLNDSPIIARYDLIIAASESKFKIFDWKTSMTRAKRTWLANRMQTRIYPFLLVLAGAHLNHNQLIAPNQVSMVYWFTAFPNQPEEFVYTFAQFEADRQYLNQLFAEIHSLSEPAFTLTTNIERCLYCVYRSLCNRGVSAGSLSSASFEPNTEDNFDLNLDIEQVSEIQF